MYEVRNLAGTILMSNDKVVVFVDETDRRFVIFETGDKYRNDQVFFAAYEKYMLKPENQRAIYDFLMKRDISKVDWVKDRPRTKAYIEMVSSNLSPCLKWFAEFIDNYPFEFHDQNHGMRRRENIHKWKADETAGINTRSHRGRLSQRRKSNEELSPKTRPRAIDPSNLRLEIRICPREPPRQEFALETADVGREPVVGSLSCNWDFERSH